MSDPREEGEFFLTVPAKLDDPFPDLAYFREHRPVFYYAPLRSWFVFRFDDVSALFHDARLSADRMKGFVDAAPAEVREELKRISPQFETWVLMKDGADHARASASSPAATVRACSVGARTVPRACSTVAPS